MTAKGILKEAKKLSADKREKLAEQIFASVDEECENTPLSEEMTAELQRRIAYMKEHPNEWIPWEKVKSELQARRRKRCAR